MASSTSFSLTISCALLPKPFFSSPSSSHFRIPQKPLIHFQNPPPFPKIRSHPHQTTATPITKDLWENTILKSETPVLVEFYASWCGPCRMVHRIIDEIVAEYAGKLKCFILNTDTDMQIAEDYEIKVVPVVLLFKNGQKYDSVIGTMPKEFYVAAIERVLKS
ncbi:hypothetical protein RJT34_04607 [Clitoria ternatea]|uniref:Thioredoxin domain-containing protein n=1 Tax=Clitoria ternatea TaxID=43366 RepID=A0AAN9Q3K7_CLITE